MSANARSASITHAGLGVAATSCRTCGCFTPERGQVGLNVTNRCSYLNCKTELARGSTRPFQGDVHAFTYPLDIDGDPIEHQTEDTLPIGGRR